MHIAALIPVYAEPKALVGICRTLSGNTFHDKEIIVVVDGSTSPSIQEALDRIRMLPDLRIIEGQPHLGKAKALNLAVRNLKADGILFLDNDIILPEDPDFLTRLARELEARALVELPKCGRGQGFLAEMMKLEFLSNLLSAETVCRCLAACPSMNGAAFAIRRADFLRLGGFAGKVNEDMDLAARAFFAGCDFGFPPELAVGNMISGEVKDWLKQRKRWLTNNALWMADHLWPCLKSSPRTAGAMAFSSLRFSLPYVATALGLGSALLATRLLGIGGWQASLAAALAAGAGWAAAARSFKNCAKRYGSEFSYRAFLVFNALYMPLMAIANSFTYAYIALGYMPKLDWKIGEDTADIQPKTVHRLGPPIEAGSRIVWLGDPKLAPPRSLGLAVSYARYRVRSTAVHAKN